MQINQVTEDSHVQAMLTLTAERRELLLCRQHIESLKGALEEGRKVNEEQAVVINRQEKTIALLHAEETDGQ